MKKYYYSILAINKDDNNLLNFIDNISQQEINLEEIEIIIETTKLPKELKKELANSKLNIKIREQKKYDIATMYNDAIKESSGKYINLTTTNTTFESTKTLSKIKQLNEHKIITTSIYFENPINNKNTKYIFSKPEECIIDLKKTKELINLSIESYFIDKSIIKNIKFDSKFGIETTIKFIIDLYDKNKIRYNLGTHNLLTKTAFENHKKLNEQQYDKSWYEKSINNWTKYIKSLKKIPVYTQSIILYLLYIKFNSNLESDFKYESDNWFDKVEKILSYIDEKYIIQTTDSIYKIPRNIKQYFVKLRNCANPDTLINYESEKIMIQAINYDNEKLTFDAKVDLSDYLKEKDYKIIIEYNNQEIPITRNYIYSNTKAFNKIINTKYTFKFTIDTHNNYGKLKAKFIYKNQTYNLVFDFTKPQSRLDNNKHAYWSYKKIIIKNKKNKLIITKNNILKKIILEPKYCLAKFIQEKNKIRTLKLICLRFLYYLTKPSISKKHIWITYDKLYKGGDNGEYLYQYGLKHNKPIYYIIKKDSPDYSRLIKEKNNKILIFNSLKAKLYCLHAEVILQTHAGILGFCGFDGRARTIVRDLLNAYVMEAQHGLTIQDIPEYQNRIADNNQLYFIASPNEDKNISQPIYDYSKDQIKYTGISRYDGLINNDQKQILITPTWRHSIASASLKHGTVRAYNNSFKKSDYFKIYNSLINNEELISVAKVHGYKLIYLIHPTLSEQINDFDKNDYVDIYAAASNVSYEKLLTESSVMVTDYSGVQYDFAYMRKPIVYFHPEELPPHYNNGSIDYEKEGFGPITTNIDELVKTLCELIKKDCKNTDKYIKRANKFFTYNDLNSSERIVKEIEKFLQNKR